LDVSSHHSANRFFINLGEMDGFNWRSLKDFISDETGIPTTAIKNTDVKKSFSFFEVSSNDVDKVMALNGKQFNNRTISVEKSVRQKKEGERSSGSDFKSYRKDRHSENRSGDDYNNRYNENKDYKEKRKRIYRNND